MAASRHKIKIAAASGTVFPALSTADGLRGWYAPIIEGDVIEGAEFTMTFTGQVPFRWRVAQLQPHRSIRWECVAGPGDSTGTTVTFNVSEPDSESSIVECDHDGWDEDHPHFSTCNTLWGILLGQLKRHVETGRRELAVQ